MKRFAVVLALGAISYPLAAAEKTYSIVEEVASLRHKYDECRQGQPVVQGIDPKKYDECRRERSEERTEQEKMRTRIADLETRLQSAQKRILELEGQKKNLSESSKAVPTVPPKLSLNPPATPPKVTAALQPKPLRVPEEPKKLPKAHKDMHEVRVSDSKPAEKVSGAYAYRMLKASSIYNAPNGSVVDTWEERRSFTAATASNGWIRISGYFVNRVWQPVRSEEALWVRESDTIRR